MEELRPPVVIFNSTKFMYETVVAYEFHKKYFRITLNFFYIIEEN